MSTFLIILSAIANIARGRKLFELTTSTMLGRLVSMLSIAMGTQVFLGADIWTALIVWVGLVLWSIKSWGQYFNVFMGETLKERRVAFWGMTLRGGHMYPMFIALALNGYELAPIVGLGCFLQGVAYGLMYWLPNTWNRVMIAEGIYGAVIGAMLAWAL